MRTATPRQLALLRRLADSTASTFAHPQTLAQAQAEIAQLKRLTPLRGRGHRDPTDPARAGRDAYATAPLPGEIVGYGSSARRRRGEPSRTTGGRTRAKPARGRDSSSRNPSRAAMPGSRAARRPRVGLAVRRAGRSRSCRVRALVPRRRRLRCPPATSGLCCEWRGETPVDQLGVCIA